MVSLGCTVTLCADAVSHNQVSVELMVVMLRPDWITS
jgi:hypothetical protein